jgi:hypothetical protein
LTSIPVHRRTAQLAIAFMLLALALAVALARPARSLGSTANACSSSTATRAKWHVRACAGRRRSVHAHAKVTGRHANRDHSKKKKSAATRKSGHAPVAALQPATCEDGTTPKREESEFACGDGSEPACTSGAEPLATRSGTRPLCPATRGSGTEFSEASCEDGSAPERAGAHGAYACEDGSRPSCEDGTQPTQSDDGSMLVCITHGAPGSSAPAEEGEESESEEDEADSRRASA